MIGATTIRMARMKASPSGFMSAPTLGQKWPTRAPRMTPKMTCAYKDFGALFNMIPPLFLFLLWMSEAQSQGGLRRGRALRHGRDGARERLGILLGLRRLDHASHFVALQ